MGKKTEINALRDGREMCATSPAALFTVHQVDWCVKTLNSWLTDVELKHFWLHCAGTNKANALSHTFIWALISGLQSRFEIALLSVSKVDWLCAECKGAYKISSYEEAEFDCILPWLLDVSSNKWLQCGHEICLEFHVKYWHSCLNKSKKWIRQLLSLPPEIGNKML